jgi:hypothetical protein
MISWIHNGVEERLPHHKLDTKAVSSARFGTPFLHTDHYEELTMKLDTKSEALSDVRAYPFLHDNLQVRNIRIFSLTFGYDMDTAFELP